jgi:hypothetical protein
MNMETLLILAGLGQLSLIVVILIVPRILKWAEQLKTVRALTRQLFWAYVGYMLYAIVAMGLLSLLGPEHLLDKSPLATMLCAYIFIFWTARFVLQFTYFDRKDAPDKVHVKMAEVYLVLLYFYLASVYAYAFYLNLPEVV